MKYLGACLLLITLTGCQSLEQSYVIGWQVPENEAHRYDMIHAEISVNPDLLVSGFDVLKKPALRKEIKLLMSEIELPAPAYEATVERYPPYIRAKAVGILPDFENPPADLQEEFDRATLEANAGKVVLLGDFSEGGHLTSFFFEKRQQSLSNLLFSLPGKAMSIGESWPLEVYGLELSAGFVPEHSDRISNAYLENVSTNDEGQKIAELFYLIAEHVSGYFTINNGEGTEQIPLDITLSYFALARFLIDEGRWLDFTALRVHNTRGTEQDSGAMVYALRPLAAD